MNANTGNAVDALLDAPSVAPDRSNQPAVVKSTSGSNAAHAAANALGIIREWMSIHSLTATRCACCGIALRDAVSVERGIGPVCSKKHYDLSDMVITKGMVEEALGLLHASGLEKLVKRAAKSLKEKPRDLCNILIWWSSAHLDETETVLDCAAIVTALGFTALGDRLRERNTDVLITKDGENHFILRCRSDMNVRRNLSAVKGASKVGREGRFKYAWKVPNDAKRLVWTILGEAFGGEFATVPGEGDGSKVVKVTPKSAYQVRKALREANASKDGTPGLPIVRFNARGHIEIHTPEYNRNFVDELKHRVSYRDREWSRQNQCWTIFRPDFANKVRTLVASHFNGAV